MNGNKIRDWDLRAIRVKLLENGNIITVARKRGRNSSWKTGRNSIQELDWRGNLVWEYMPPGNTHHDVQRLQNGNTLLLYNEDVPEEYRQKIVDPLRKSVSRLSSDVVLEVSPEKKIVWEWHMYEHLDLNQYCRVCNPGDWTHTNTVQALPENKWYDNGDDRFKPGHILLSPRNLGFIFIVDRDTKEVVWRYSGSYAGGLAGQHEPHMIEKGLPGEGNIIIFDNGSPPLNNIAHAGNSYIIEINPAAKTLIWKYEERGKFYSTFESSVQRLPNGNTLICELEGHRIFEVNSQSRIVWEYSIDQRRHVGRAYRYSYDYCPQLETLERPKERKVKPPPHAVLEPSHLFKGRGSYIDIPKKS